MKIDPYYWFLLIAILAISSSGSALKMLDRTPPLLKAFWRLFVHSLVMLFPCIYQVRKMDAESRARYFRLDTVLTLLVSGLSLSIHFGCWIWSLNLTSLAHSFVFVSIHPLIVICWMVISGSKVSALEVASVVVGFTGAGIMMLDLKSDREITIQGDVLAFIGGVAIVVYMFAGKKCRDWMPLFAYTLPVTFVATLPLLLLSMTLEPIRANDLSAVSIWGWLNPTAPYYALPITLFVVFGPGICGHTFINLVLQRISPLVVSISMTCEPVLGTLIGTMLGLSEPPQLYTCIGGPLNILGTIGTIIGTSRREAIEKRQQEQLREETSSHLPSVSLPPSPLQDPSPSPASLSHPAAPPPLALGATPQLSPAKSSVKRALHKIFTEASKTEFVHLKEQHTPLTVIGEVEAEVEGDGGERQERGDSPMVIEPIGHQQLVMGDDGRIYYV